MTRINMQDRCRGVLLGLAAGDRIGGPTRMALHLAESLLELGRFDSADILARYLQWWREGAFDTGPVSERALQLMAGGMTPQDAVAQVHKEFDGKTAGCNPAHRSPPLAMLSTLSDEELSNCAHTEARLSHYDPLAGEVAAAVNVLCRSLICGATWENALQRATQDVRTEFKESLFSTETPGGNGGFAPEVLRAAIFFVGTSSEFSEALRRSMVFAGAANYCPVLVGVIGGARWGCSAIPSEELAHVEILPGVEKVAHDLVAGWVKNVG